MHLQVPTLLAAGGASLNWVTPLWIVGVGVAGLTAISFALYYLLMAVAPKVAATAHTTAKEAWPQPLFWVTLSLGCVLLLIFPFIPVLHARRRREDDQGLGPGLGHGAVDRAGCLDASVSVSDEIEGRTALTLLSKPVGRRQFILGKFLGVLADGFDVSRLGALLSGDCIFQGEARGARPRAPSRPPPNVRPRCCRSCRAWRMKFMEATMLASISVALSTRLAMLPNLVLCVTIYALGHLAPMFANAFRDSRLVSFFGQFVATVLPNLDDFDIPAAVSTGRAVPIVYLAWAAVDCALYSTVAMVLAF